MPRPIWTGAISFGLVTIPVRLTTASENHNVTFRRIHLEDGGRVRNQKYCELDGQVVTDDDIGRGYELTKDRIVPVTDEELDDMPLPTRRSIEIIAFVDREGVDPIRLGQSYYLEGAGQVAAKPYTLMRRALERSGKAAVAKFALRDRERLGLLSVRDDALVLHSMHWPDEVRDPSELAPRPVDLDEGEIEQALALIEGMTTDDISGFHDEYRQAVETLIEAKAEGKQPPKAPEQARPGEVVDLMAALEKSVARAREARGEDATVHEMPARKAPARKKAAKKAAGRTAEKAAPRKSTPRGTAKRSGRGRSA